MTGDAVQDVTADADTFTCNVWLAPGETTTLIDAGAMPGVVEAVRDHVDDIDRVVLTHQHGDHVEQLGAVVDAFDPAVAAYADHPLRTEGLADGDDLRVGDEAVEVVHTPGHAADHVSLVGPTTLFSGDVVVHDDGAFDDGSFGRTDMPGADRETLIDALETLLARLPDGVEHMYAGHGSAFHGNVRAVVDRALSRAERRQPKYPDE
ncbi:MAG: MBL fold metallo-hydrolase [Halobacteriaceae archaeon]